MELDDICNTYTVSLTSSERRLLGALTSGGSPGSDARLERRVKELADARTMLSRLPDGTKTERQRRSEKAAMLKERLKLLKQMIPFLSLSAAKSLKVEMQQISSQIASLGSTSGALFTGGTGTATDVPMGEQQATENTEALENPQSRGSTGADGTIGKDRDTPRSGGSPESVTAGAGSDAAEEKALQGCVAELQQLHRAVKALLRRKLQLPDIESKRQESPAQIMAYLSLSGTGRNLTVKG